MQTVKFTYQNGYKCSLPGDQEGEYIKKKEVVKQAKSLLAIYDALLELTDDIPEEFAKVAKEAREFAGSKPKEKA